MLLTAPLRRLTDEDIPACLDLAVDQEWSPEAGKWRLLLATGDGFGIDDPESGRLVATVIVTRYQGELAAIGMLLVLRTHARRGLGTRLVRHAIEHARSATVFLYATEVGEPLYRKLGFGAIDSVVRHRGGFRPDDGEDPRIRPARPADLAALVELDRATFGASRDAVLTRFVPAAECCYVVDEGGVHGYAAAWRNVDTLMIGPVVAADDHTAARLIHTIASRAGREVCVDVRAGATTLSGWLVRHGLSPLPPAPLMTIGARQLPGARQRLYSPIMQALG